MRVPITNVQEQYILGLLESVGQEKYQEFKSDLKIPKKTQISELTKDEAYKLITKMISESSTQAVEKALAAALEAEKAETNTD